MHHLNCRSALIHAALFWTQSVSLNLNVRRVSQDRELFANVCNCGNLVQCHRDPGALNLMFQ